MKTTNTLDSIVPGSRVLFQGTIYDVGEVTETSAKLYLSGRYVVTVDIKDVEPI